MYIAPILKGCKVKIARRQNERRIFVVYILEDIKLGVYGMIVLLMLLLKRLLQMFLILVCYYNL